MHGKFNFFFLELSVFYFLSIFNLWWVEHVEPLDIQGQLYMLFDAHTYSILRKQQISINPSFVHHQAWEMTQHPCSPADNKPLRKEIAFESTFNPCSERRERQRNGRKKGETTSVTTEMIISLSFTFSLQQLSKMPKIMTFICIKDLKTLLRMQMCFLERQTKDN